jgi:hypothetical protein
VIFLTTIPDLHPTFAEFATAVLQPIDAVLGFLAVGLLLVGFRRQRRLTIGRKGAADA